LFSRELIRSSSESHSCKSAVAEVCKFDTFSLNASLACLVTNVNILSRPCDGLASAVMASLYGKCEKDLRSICKFDLNDNNKSAAQYLSCLLNTNSSIRDVCHAELDKLSISSKLNV